MNGRPSQSGSAILLFTAEHLLIFASPLVRHSVSDCDRGGRRSVPVNLAVPSGTQRPCIFFLWIPCIVHSISPRRRVSLARRSPPTRRRGSADRSHQFPNIKSPY